MSKKRVLLFGITSLMVGWIAGCGEDQVSTVSPPAPTPTAIAVEPASVTLAALGETAQLVATALDQQGNPMPGVGVVWASSDGSVATVSASGLVTAVWNGSTTITATVQGGGPSATGGVTVEQRANELVLSPDSATLRSLGDTLRLIADAFDSNGHLIPLVELAWSSEDGSVATVDTTGLVTATGNGSATVRAASGSATASAELTVEQQAVEVWLSSSADTLRAFGDTVRLVLSGTDANGHSVEGRLGTGFNWSAGDESVATVDAEGLVTAVGNGSTTITADSGNGLGAISAVLVEQRADSVQVSAAADTLRALGDTTRLAARAFDANDYPMVVEDVEFTWASGDETVATVDGSGLVTAVGNGAATISAALEGDVTSDLVVVVEQEATSIRVSPPADTLSPHAAKLQLSAEAFDANDYLVAAARFLWSSSDESVATVNATGLVTTKGPGSVEITAALVGTDLTAAAALLIVVVGGDRGILEEFYHATGGPDWKNNENWLTDAPMDSWYGVGTDSKGSIVVLELSDNGLTGTIPTSVGSLARLVRLELRENQLSGALPPEIGRLSLLWALDLIGNNLSGSIPPEFGNLTLLANLWLDRNELSGVMPPELGNLRSLRQLRLGFNRLEGSIPPELGGLRELTNLYLRANRLSGVIPSELGDLPSLTTLDLSRNMLVGSLPREFGSLTTLASLIIADNDLTGPLPPVLGYLANLKSIYADDNAFSGSIPRELGYLTSLGQLWLKGNNLTGEIPQELGNLSSLTDLHLSGNALTGPIPPELGDLPDLRQLYVDENQLTGEIPAELARLASLDHLKLSSNALTGSIPAEFRNLPRIRILELDNNQLAGPIPAGFGQLARLQGLSLSSNPLTGAIPQEFVNLQLDQFHWTGTMLCAPANQTFQMWLQGISSHRGGQTCAP